MLCVLFNEEVINCGRHVNTGMLGAAFDVVGSGYHALYQLRLNKKNDRS